MRKEHRLGVLEVGPTRHGCPRVRLGLADERVSHVEGEPADDLGFFAEIHPHQGRDLVIARTSGTELSTEVDARTLDEPTLESRVDVLVGKDRQERPRLDVSRQGVERGEHVRQLVLGEQPRGPEHASVRP